MADDASVVAMPMSQPPEMVDAKMADPGMLKAPTPIGSPRVEEQKQSREQTPRSAKGTPRDRRDVDATFDDEDESLMPGRHEPSFRYGNRRQQGQTRLVDFGCPTSPRHTGSATRGFTTSVTAMWSCLHCLACGAMSRHLCGPPHEGHAPLASQRGTTCRRSGGCGSSDIETPCEAVHSLFICCCGRAERVGACEFCEWQSLTAFDQAVCVSQHAIPLQRYLQFKDCVHTP